MSLIAAHLNAGVIPSGGDSAAISPGLSCQFRLAALLTDLLCQFTVSTAYFVTELLRPFVPNKPYQVFVDVKHHQPWPNH